jgi:ubiquinone biosynthesis protein UbiJ
VLPSRNEAEAQFTEIDRLRDVVERVAARIERVSRHSARQRQEDRPNGDEA